jgi:hypothetical protein
MFDRVLIIDDDPVRLPTVTQLLAKSDTRQSPAGSQKTGPHYKRRSGGPYDSRS